ncbi:MAG: acetyl-CoA carboxylase biotin carboxyl carrier protein subunit [Rhodospirillaceae bacterium]|nr:acetyl-CoA carboxylase biotin carboxyl carrier protein subunit [Rhodospirillaceae bacterium]
MAAKSSIDGEIVRSLASLLNETNLSEIEYETQGLRIRVARNLQIAAQYAPPPAAPVAVPASADAGTAAVEDPANHPGALKSPMVGVVYFAPEPGAPPFIGLGDSVSEGQTLLLIEAMKTFNPITATRSGKVLSILVEDGQPVEYGEPLLIIG